MYLMHTRNQLNLKFWHSEIITKQSEIAPFLRVFVCVSCSVMSNSMQPHGLQPTRLLCPQDIPGKNTAVGCHSLLQGIFSTQGLNSGSSLQADSLPSESPGKSSTHYIKYLFGSFSSSFACDSLLPHRLGPARLLCPWNFPRQEYWTGEPFYLHQLS